MKVAVWLVASLGAALACGAASAEDKYPTTMQFTPPSIGGVRVMPMPAANRRPSPAALACDDSSGMVSADARIAACEKLIKAGKWKGKDIAWALANQCVAFNAKGETDKALSACDEAIKLDPDGAFSYQLRAQIMEKRGDRDKALADYDKAIQSGSKSVSVFIDRGDILLAKGDVDKAMADYDQAIKFNNKGSLAHIGRGGAWLAKGDINSAMTDFNTAIELSPDNAIAWADRGAAYFEKGDTAKAVENFRHALKLNPANAYAALWVFISRGGDGAEAKSELKADSARLSRSAAWPWPVAQFYLGDKDAAQTLAAAATPGAQCEAQYYVGQERLLKKADAEALPYLRKAVETCPKDFVEFFHAEAELKKLTAAAAPKADAAAKTDTAPKAVSTPKAAAPAESLER